MGEVKKPSEAQGIGFIYEVFANRRQPSPATAIARDGADIGNNARELNRARAAVEAAPEIRADRVTFLRRQVEHGTYQPNVHEVARQILARGL